MAAASSSPRQGDLIGRELAAGRYVVTGLLGTGSQGDTLDAIDKREGRPCAIKRFQVKGAHSWKDVELAEREAEVLVSLSHPLLPRAFDRFEQDGALYLVMEKIDGASLAGAKLTRAEVATFLRDAAAILGYLHARVPPVIHRDIKPANFIRRRGARGDEFVLVDFGSVRARLDRGGSTVVGTFGYMAPEQLQGRASPATDVYGVGVSAMRLLTGVEPEDLPHKGLAIDVAACLPELARRGDPLVGALTRMVEPDPDKRAADLGPLLAEIDRAPPVRPRRTERDDTTRLRDEARAWRDELRDAANKWRKERRRARKERWKARAGRRLGRIEERLRPRWLPWPLRALALVMLLGLWLQARVLLGAFVPWLLRLLAVFAADPFERILLRAAARVRGAGAAASDRLAELARYIDASDGRGEPPRPEEPVPPSTRSAGDGVEDRLRVETPPETAQPEAHAESDAHPEDEGDRARKDDLGQRKR